ncbi:MAG: NTP transferase domain-containing protein [Candidatus Zixiibacteriota bacterium]|nr:MAG: NTP transferase domain-containing protein [candidate division Zixibacteria bacterium]
MAQYINKGILLAGGAGTRLYPASAAVSKQLLAVYDKPLIYYSLSVLMRLGIRDILLITHVNDEDRFRALLGDGSHLGIKLNILSETRPRGIANAFLIGEDFIGRDNVTLLLGDNIYCDTGPLKSAAESYRSGAVVFGVHVTDPSEYGVADVDCYGNVTAIEEKPVQPKSDIAVTGLYFYDDTVVQIARGIQPSERGELEITTVNNVYLERKQLRMVTLDANLIWFDAGSAQSMLNAGNYISSLESTAERKIGCIEEAAYLEGFITAGQLTELAEKMPDTDYRDYLLKLVR